MEIETVVVYGGTSPAFWTKLKVGDPFTPEKEEPDSHTLRWQRREDSFQDRRVLAVRKERNGNGHWHGLMTKVRCSPLSS